MTDPPPPPRPDPPPPPRRPRPAVGAVGPDPTDEAILRQLRNGAWAEDMGRAFRPGWGRHIPLTREKEG
jgi:hypothetical protein